MELKFHRKNKPCPLSYLQYLHNDFIYNFSLTKWMNSSWVFNKQGEEAVVRRLFKTN